MNSVESIFSHPKFTLASGALILIFSFLPLQLWLSIFVVFMSEFPVNGIGMDLSQYCSLQIKLSNFFSGWTQNSFLPLLIIVHGSAFLFIYRARRKDQLPALPLEFGTLNFMFLLLGTGLFICGLIVEIIIAVATRVFPGSESFSLFGCRTTGGFWPGLLATLLATAGLFSAQATGWFSRWLTRLSPVAQKNSLIILLIFAALCALLTWPILASIL